MSWKIIIISGGQTGASRAALDVAVAGGIPYGGWCPKGRVALDGPIDAKYQLRETPTEDPLQRMEWNVRDADATVVFTLAAKITGGSKKTVAFARGQDKPWIHLHRGLLAVSEKLVNFLGKHGVRRLNIAGSRESEEPGIYDWVAEQIRKASDLAEKRERAPFQFNYSKL
jgi:hypothetical protein